MKITKGDHMICYLKIIVVMVFLPPILARAQNYQIDWYVIGSGGGHSSSGNYQIDGTIGQPIIGQSSSPNYIIESGFWVGFGVGGGCEYTPGDANGNGAFNGLDVTYSVNYLKGIGPIPPDNCDCPPHGILLAAADANGNCAFNGLDVTYSVNYLKGLGGPPQACDDCEPAGFAPAVEPIKMPVNRTARNGN
jgi:hypothetical protein